MVGMGLSYKPITGRHGLNYGKLDAASGQADGGGGGVARWNMGSFQEAGVITVIGGIDFSCIYRET